MTIHSFSDKFMDTPIFFQFIFLNVRSAQTLPFHLRCAGRFLFVGRRVDAQAWQSECRACIFTCECYITRDARIQPRFCRTHCHLRQPCWDPLKALAARLRRG